MSKKDKTQRKEKRESSKKVKGAKKATKKATSKKPASKKKPSQVKTFIDDLKMRIYGNGQPKKIPSSAQETIPYIKMYPDGICQVTETYYTRMVEFNDINYDLLEIEDQSDILETYSKFLNYFDPAIHVQLFLFGRQVDAKTLTERFEVPLQNDAEDELRLELSEILKNQAEKGRNGVIKTKHIVFGTDCESLKDAKNKLDNIQKDVVRNLNELGTRAHGLNGEERLRILHDYFNQDSMKPFQYTYEAGAKNGMTTKDGIAPMAFDFRYANQFKTGDMWGSSFYVDIVSPRFSDEFLKRLLDIDENLTISVHMQTLDPVKAMKQIKMGLTNIQKNKIDEQKKAVRSGYDMDILPPDIVTYEKDALELLEDLNSSNQRMIQVSFLITCFGHSKKQLDNLIQRVSGIVQQANCTLRPMQYLQEQTFMACAPLGVNETNVQRSLPTRCVAVMVPFCTRELFMDGEALYYGLNALSSNMILADRKKLRTPNGLILGTPGSGKSFSAKREILSCKLMTRDDIVICDPEGEYFALVNELNGQVVRLATDSKDFLNPMDIQVTDDEGANKEELKFKSSFLITFCDTVAGGDVGLTNDEIGIIDQCNQDIYMEYFKNPTPENMPILEDLYDALMSYDPAKHTEKEMPKELIVEGKKKAVRIANCLSIYVHGSQDYFNHRSNIDSENRILCFDIRDLTNQLKQLGMLIVQDAVWNRVSKNREKKISTRYYCDEFHLLLKEKQTAVYSVEIWKRFRKWGGIPTGLTQNVGDFLRSEEIEGILGNSDFIYLLNQNAKDQQILADKLGLSAKQLSHVTNSEQGCGLILYNDIVIPFADNYPTNTKTYRVMSTRLDEAVIKEDEVVEAS